MEKLGVGSGATGHAAGLIRHHYPDAELVRMTKYCSQKLEHFEEEMAFPIDFVKNGFCYLAPQSPAEMAEIIAMQRAQGVDVEMLTPEELRRLHPKGAIDPEGVGVGLYDHDAGYADPYKVAVGYAERARELGVDIRCGAEVQDILIEKGRVTGVVTNRGTIAAPLVVNAAGIGAVAINRMAGVELPLRYMSLGHGVLIPDEPFETNILTINDASREEFLFFLRPESGGTVLIGMDQDLPDREIVPETYYMDAPFDRIGKYYEHLVKRMPFIAGYRLQTAFGALDLRTPDWNPGVGFLADGPEGFYLAVGGSGHSFKLAPALGEVISQELTGEAPSFDFSIFDVNRLRSFTDADFGGSFFINE